jgi:hypothetical protein
MSAVERIQSFPVFLLGPFGRDALGKTTYKQKSYPMLSFLGISGQLF